MLATGLPCCSGAVPENMPPSSKLFPSRLRNGKLGLNRTGRLCVDGPRSSPRRLPPADSPANVPRARAGVRSSISRQPRRNPRSHTDFTVTGPSASGGRPVAGLPARLLDACLGEQLRVAMQGLPVGRQAPQTAAQHLGGQPRLVLALGQDKQSGVADGEEQAREPLQARPADPSLAGGAMQRGGVPAEQGQPAVPRTARWYSVFPHILRKQASSARASGPFGARSRRTARGAAAPPATGCSRSALRAPHHGAHCLGQPTRLLQFVRFRTRH